MKPPDTAIGGSRRDFPTTPWSALLDLREGGHPDRPLRLAHLVGLYWKPVYWYIRGGWRRDVEEAKDLAQDFFTRLIEKQDWSSVSPEKGSFRSFIKAALRHFMANVHDAERVRRPPEWAQMLHFEQAEAEWRHLEPEARERPPDEIFDRGWVRQVFEEAIYALRQALAERGKDIYYQAFRLYHYGTLDETGGPPAEADLTYEEVGKRLGLQPGDVRNYLAYARSELRLLLRDLVRTYVDDEKAADDEIRFLLS